MTLSTESKLAILEARIAAIGLENQLFKMRDEFEAKRKEAEKAGAALLERVKSEAVEIGLDIEKHSFDLDKLEFVAKPEETPAP